MIGEYEDDAHICLKCHTTIIGLDNYVNHRKNNCSKNLNLNLPEDAPFNLKADDFFSSLELQSSSKKPPTPSTSGKSFSGILTRSKTSAAIQGASKSIPEDTHRNKQLTSQNIKEVTEIAKTVPDEIQTSKSLIKERGEAETSNLIEEHTTKSPVIDIQRNTSEAKSPTSTSGKNAWIGGHQLKIFGYEDNQTRLIKAVDNLSRHTYLKKESDSVDIGIYDDSDEDSDDYAYDEDEYDEDEDDDIPPPRTGGKWKNDDLKIPPRTFTGGKWKPASPIGDWNEGKGKYVLTSPQNLSKESVDSNESASPNISGGKWSLAKADTPPLNHTKVASSPNVSGGKWSLAKADTPSLIKLASSPNVNGGKWSLAKADTPPLNHAKVVSIPNVSGGKWSSLAKADAPPSNHTKGKWKPAKPEHYPPAGYSKGKWKEKIEEQIPPPEHTKGKWKPPVVKETVEEQFPPPGHTKGKWKPVGFKDKEKGDEPTKGKFKGKVKTTVKRKAQFSPPGHTKGKWKPDKRPKTPDKKKQANASPFRKSNQSVQFWCGPCNRNLATKIVYQRHLKSELHMKRMLRERELEDSSNLHSDKKNEYWPTTIETSDPNKTIAHDSDADSDHKTRWEKMQKEDVNKRIRKKKFIICSVCKSRVTSQMMGKHLISHYHCRKADLSTHEAQKLILDNIYSIILQSPYQCTTCRFYFNTHEDFLQHWKTNLHEGNVHNRPGYLWCSFCKFSCSDNTSMYVHLTSHEHLEVLSVINKSVPILINKINPLSCDTCTKTFVLNIQLRKHCEEENHKFSGTASDEYQNKIYCNLCEGVFKSPYALQRHIKNDHNTKIFFCSVCQVNFDSAVDAAKHRTGEAHRAKTQKPVPKTCEYCEIVLGSFLAYKKHLQEAHPEHTHKCPHCGKSFTLPQEVTVHIRSKSCAFTQEEKSANPNTCDRCPYSTESVSDLIYHKALHGNPVMVVKEGSAKELSCYKCPLCHKSFTKHSLKFHIRNHMNEKAYECSYCGMKFARKNNWTLHVKKHVVGKVQSVSRVVAEQVFQCGVCEATFKQKSTLNNHMIIHTGKKFKCPTPNCFHAARSAAELKIHEKVHSEEKTYKCSTCDYVGKTKILLRRHEVSHENVKKYKCSKCNFTARFAFHLKRHELVHTGAKPYACPHCDYKCNTIENLRKHVLSTNKHPGKRLYECKFCDEHQFHTNFAKDFRLHLITAHSSVFGSGSEATSYIAGIYDNKPAGIVGIIAGKDANSGMMPLELPDSNMDNNVLIATQATPSYSNINKGDDLFGDEVTCVDKDAWSIVASFDVEETSRLVSFDAEEEDFFEEDFIDH